jgi:4-hydroxy-3-methylbut-2-enyl diphosphate reductase
MEIKIDENSGFCFGVVYAIQRAEEELAKSDTLHCLGDIVHNNVEVERLRKKGLITIDHKQLKNLHDCKVLIRAHGEPPETYKIALENNIKLLDASCPVVLRLQNNIKTGFDEINNYDGQVIIYGEKGHAEVNGLIGQTQGKGIVISDLSDLDKIDFSKPINIFSQTTKSLEGYEHITAEIKKRMHEIRENEDINFTANKTICSQVSRRDAELKNFSKNHEIIIFVSGVKSSNGKVLYEVCRSQNPRTYFVSDVQDLKSEWFENVESVGICGATSTPRWLMEKIKDQINNC